MSTNNLDNELGDSAMIYPDQLTKHAEMRIQVRRIRAELLDYLVEYGRCTALRSRRTADHGRRGACHSSVESYSFTGRTWERFEKDHPELAKRYHRCRNLYAVISNGCVITAAYCPAPRHKRRR